MRQPANTPVEIERPAAAPSLSGNSLPILHEIRHGLERLAESGESTRIDLSSLPFGPGDEERLLRLLGEGEVEARVHALGITWVRESAVQGVWIVDHRNLDEQRLTLHIEITRAPEILRTQRQDVLDGIATLDARLERLSDGPGA